MNKYLKPLLLIMLFWCLIIPIVKWGWEYEWIKITFSALSAFIFFGLVSIIHQNKMPTKIPGVMLFTGIIGVWIVVSIISSIVPVKGFVEIIKVLGPFFIYPALIIFAPDENDMDLLTIAIAIGVIISASIGFAQLTGVYGYIPTDQYGRINPISTFGLSNFGAEYIVSALPLLISQFIFRKKLWISIVLSIGIIEGILYVIISHSRASWAALIIVSLVSIGILISVRKKRQFKINLSPLYIAGMVVAGTLLLSLIFSQTSNLIKHFTSIFDVYYSDNIVRLLTWKSILVYLAPSHPVLGIGFGAFDAVFPLYADRALSLMTFSNHVTMNYAHNEYLNILAETGIPGFLMFIGLLIYILYEFVSSISEAQEKDIPVLIGGFLGFINLLIIGLFSFPLRMPATAVLFWMYAGIGSLYAHSTFNVKPYVWKISNYVLVVVSFLVFIAAFHITLAQRAYLLANTLFKQNRTQSSAMTGKIEDKLSYAITQAPFYKNYFFDRAMIRINLGNRIGALKDLKDTINLSPYYLQARRWLGILYSDKGDYSNAMKQLNMAYKLAYFSPTVQAIIMNDQTVVLIRKGNYTSALNIVKKAQLLDPYNYALFELQGEASEHLGLYDQSLQAFKHALKLNPDQKDTAVNLASLYIQLKKYDMALSLLKNVKQPDAYVYYNLACAHARMGNYREAWRNISIAIKMNKALYTSALNDPDLSALQTFLKKLPVGLL